MLTQYETVPEGLLDLPASRLGKVLPGPALIHLAGRRQSPLFVSAAARQRGHRLVGGAIRTQEI
ncbi:MAG: hypothetical protein Q8K35_04360 [Thiobacillus sp.]|nr:hypothetical protein [Thiobacillus sp.]MDP2056979.1 hypothetical protein [Thiobacillus sp.]